MVRERLGKEAKTALGNFALKMTIGSVHRKTITTSRLVRKGSPISGSVRAYDYCGPLLGRNRALIENLRV